MTPEPKTLLAELTEAIVKAVPEIQEHPSIRVVDGYPECSRCQILEECFDRYACQRPITLEDMLRALEKNLRGEDPKIFAVTMGGKFIQAAGMGIWAGVRQHWELGLPLHQQSEETIDFLYSLLCV